MTPRASARAASNASDVPGRTCDDGVLEDHGADATGRRRWNTRADGPVAPGVDGRSVAPGPGAGEETKEHEVTVVEVEIWSDVVCPWCYVGKRQFEEALAGSTTPTRWTVSWRSYELDPTSPREVGMSMDGSSSASTA